MINVKGDAMKCCFFKRIINKKNAFLLACGTIAILLILFGILFFRSNHKNVVYSGNIEIPYTFTWQGKTYSGQYEGDVKDSFPEGEGVFFSGDKSFSYSGEWRNGVFDGKGILINENGKKEEGVYSKGRRDGYCRIYNSEKEYIGALYDRGVMCGNRCLYRDGKLIEKELLVNGMTPEELKGVALELNPEVIRTKEYLEKLIFVCGTVEYVLEDDSSCYYRIFSSGLGMVTGSFTNTDGQKTKQAFIPDLRKGDQVMIIGYYKGFYTYTVKADTDYCGFSSFKIDPVYGELLSYDESETEYEKYKVTPYDFYGIELETDYVIKNCVQNGESFNLLVGTSNTSDLEMYMLQLTGDITDFFFSGERIRIQGYYNGQYKIIKGNEEDALDQDNDAYLKYPLIEVLEYEVY